MNNIFSEFVGIFIGDGSLFVRERKHSYEFKIVGNIKKETRYYIHVAKIASLILSRDIYPKILDGGRSIGIYFCSKALFIEFKKLGFKSGKKSHSVIIPKEILTSRSRSISCLRGIFDTDGCLTLKKRYKKEPYYPAIVFGLASKKLVFQISKLLKKLGIPHCTSFELYSFDKRTGKTYTKHFLFIYGRSRVLKWLKLIGTSNPETMEKFDQIKKNSSGSWNTSSNPTAKCLIEHLNQRSLP